MRLRTSLIAATVLLSGLAGSAAAAPKKAAPVCNLIVDDKGDASLQGEPSDESLDILSADIASNATTLTAVIRVAKLAAQNPMSPTGQAYFVLFSVQGSADPLYVSAGLYPTGNEFIFGYQAPDAVLPINTSYKLGDATGIVDTDKNELRVSMPIADFASRANLKPGAKFGSLSAEARKVFGQRVVGSQDVGPARVPLGGLTARVDDALGKTYVGGTASCVKVGA